MNLDMISAISYGFSKKTPLAHLPGIGRRTPRALARYGMKTIGQFANLTGVEADALLGASGVRLWRLAQALLAEQYAV